MIDKKTLDLQLIIYKIRQFYYEQKRMPSYSELADLLEYKSKGAVKYTVDQLLERNLIEKDEKGKLIPKKLFGSYPIVGSVRAGFPSPAEEELLDTISFDQFLIQNPTATYLVRVSGDSMIEAGILPGDIVIVDRSKNAQDGDIVIAQIDNDWTMKYLQIKNNQVSLIPANKNYNIIYPKEELNIGGVIVGVVRKC